ncbi:peroxisomal membrane protein 11C isoform X2 [Hippocampus comes]|uniref:peroxisomal membrane protein 11C isoform X2 n=1 Tax=Hippocampus comes TaxID=109280 RepID=UPI00094F001E|nr:PREDICTED: peroxisomal membrane protein 11C isoform X2 [Hippocampus comes]
MQHSVDCLVRVLESYRGRDKVIRTLCYGSQLVGGIISRKAEADASSHNLGKSLLLFSAQLSHCRTVLRLFDDMSMLAYSYSYGFGAKEKDGITRWISVLTNVADQLYYPCEHVAWAADSHLLGVKSDRWSLRVLMLLKRELRKCHKDGSSHSQIDRQMQVELLSILGCMADFMNAIHWMPHGFLWAGRFPPWLVGLMGTISSVVGLIKMKEGDFAQTCSAE